MKKLLIVSHDAGGAEVVSSWVKHHPVYDVSYILEGPALAIFQKKLGAHIPCYSRDELNELLQTHDWCLAGTSGEADLERVSIKKARHYGKPIICFIDHWSQYRERFYIAENDILMPNEIWTGDEHAFQLAKSLFPQTKIVLVNNFYWQDFKAYIKAANQQVSQKNRSENLRMLYICEPIASYAQAIHANSYFFHYNEFEALEYFFSILEDPSYKRNLQTLRLRLHPLEKREKYQSFLAAYQKQFSIEISQGSLVDDLMWSDWVIGISSMALVQALFADKKVFTCAPPTAQFFKLPQKEIKPLPMVYLKD